ncbi:hypothetical protein FRB90_000355 [Tulasnella sp. 427]|nr:hypothetical protein FRB90_000355 [Tulasnella sp. 427]
MSTKDSLQRTITLVASIGVALSAGTNYVYSAYAPQLGQRLGLNHAQLNLIGFGGNAGNYLAGPFWGRAVDKHGPRPLLLSAFACLCIGYSAVRLFFDGTVSLPTDPATTFSPAVLALMFWEFVTGVGGNAGIAASLNGTAKSFPDHSRATVTGLVISGFGLSAFLFSSIAHIFFPGNTSDFLLLLALGTSIPPLIGMFFIRIVPHAQHPGHTEPITAGGVPAAAEAFSPVVGPEAYDRLDDHEEDSPEDRSSSVQFRPGSVRAPSSPNMRKPLLSRISFSRPQSETRRHSITSPHPLNEGASDGEEDAEFEELRESTASLLPKSPTKHKAVMITHPDVHGWELLKANDFWLIFCLLSLLSGTGLMYINNVGSITQALFISDRGTWEEHAGSKIQAQQVSLTSLGNCMGRALIGVSADFVHSRTGAPRVYLVTMISVIFLFSQLIARGVDHVDELWKASLAVGLAYGGTFGLLPVITIEWFGLNHFSQNWGFVSIAPVIAGNIFSLAFGKNYDAHAAHQDPLPSTTSSPTLSARGGLPTELLCYEGKECYVDSLSMTIVACLMAIVLSAYAGWMERQRQHEQRVEVWVSPADDS